LIGRENLQRLGIEFIQALFALVVRAAAKHHRLPEFPADRIQFLSLLFGEREFFQELFVTQLRQQGPRVHRAAPVAPTNAAATAGLRFAIGDGETKHPERADYAADQVSRESSADERHGRRILWVTIKPVADATATVFPEQDANSPTVADQPEQCGILRSASLCGESATWLAPSF